MISTPHRQTAAALINEAITAGTRRAKACAELEISDRTLRRWTKDGQIHADQRPLVPRPEPTNKLSAAERTAVLEVGNSMEFASLPPSQIVPKLADQGRYLASKSIFYLILRADGQQQHQRGRAKPPVRCKPPTSYLASAPCEVWTWDITWMPGPVTGMFFYLYLYLYLIVDIFSRKIVGWEVYERESADLAAVLIRQAVLAEGCFMQPLVLHADNGSPMKGATMKTTIEKLGITASYSRPRVSNDNSFSEALFRTCKYRPGWPSKGFATKTDAQAWVKPFASWYIGITASICTAPFASLPRAHATLAMTAQRWQTEPFSMQMHVRKNQNAGQAKPATGNPPDPSGSTQKPKSASLKSETPHEIGGQHL